MLRDQLLYKWSGNFKSFCMWAQTNYLLTQGKELHLENVIKKEDKRVYLNNTEKWIQVGKGDYIEYLPSGEFKLVKK